MNEAGQTSPSPRACRSCGEEAPAERHESRDAVTWLWRCGCGWAYARTESGVVDRGYARDAIARALESEEASPDER